MKFAVGFSLRDEFDGLFSDIVRTYREHISEVYFSWLDTPSGRSPLATRSGYTDWSAQERCERELRAIKDMGIKLDILFNGACYGEFAMSEKLANNVISIINHLENKLAGVHIVTTTSPFVAGVVRSFFPHLEVRASVNMYIGTVKGMIHYADLFDSYYVARERNRNIKYLLTLKDWADKNDKKLMMLANSGCFSHCSGRYFHDNLVSHEGDICGGKSSDIINPFVCRRMVTKRENYHMLLENTWIRPEDLHHYEGLFETVKLATRLCARPERVIGAYVNRRFVGNLLDLLEPALSGVIAPYIIDNTAFPKDWFEHTHECPEDCGNCGYCSEILEKVLVDTSKW